MSRKIDDRRQQAELHARLMQSSALFEQNYRDAIQAHFDEADDEELEEDFHEDAELTDEEIARQVAEAALLLRRQDVLAPPPAPGAGTSQNPDSIVDIVTFCEHDYYLGLRLTPWQEIILRTFYMGTEGNYHLSISDENPDTGCQGCVWSKNLESELEHAKTRKIKGYKSKLRVEGPENSRCLTCTRFDESIRSDRYQEMREKAPAGGKAAEKATQKIDEYEGRDNQDNYQSQMDLLMGRRAGQEDSQYEINPKVRENLLDKMGLKFQELILVLGRRSGKALALDTPIITPEGWRTIGELQVGDYVFDEKGSPTKILATSTVMSNRPCYRLTFSNGDQITADANHDWMVMDKRERKNSARSGRAALASMVTTEEIASSLCVPRKDGKKEYNHAIALAKPLHFEEKKQPIAPYLMGVWLGDGCRTNGIITTADAQIITEIEQCGYRVTDVKTAKYGWRVRENSKGVPFLTQLKALGLHKQKTILPEYLYGSIEQRIALLQGLIDTDGWVGTNGHCEFCVCDENLAHQTLELLLGLGVKATMKASNTNRTRWRIRFTPPAELMVCRLSRKRDRLALTHKTDVERVFVTRAEKLDLPIPVRCIQVDSPSQCYLAGRTMIPTHNSFMVSIIALYEAYKFLMMGHPQSRYPLKQWDEIMILNVALSEKQAKGAIFNKLREDVLASPFFASYIGKVTSTDMYLLTPADKDENKRREKTGTPLIVGSIHIKSGNSNSASQLGGTIAVIIVDEMAAMAKPTADGGSTDELLYTLLKPSIATFGFDGKIICISNPLGPFGYFYKLYNNGLDDELTLVHQLPTWLANPSISHGYIESERKKDPQGFQMQYAAKFGGGGENAWLPTDAIDAAFPSEPRFASSPMRRREHGEPLQRYYMHLDPAHSTDRYTLCILHAEPIEGTMTPDGMPMTKIVVDHLHYWMPIKKNQPINVEEVEKYVLDVGRRFRITKITYDQHWSSQSSIVKFTRAGFRCEMTPYVYQYQNLIYGELYDLFTSQRIEFYELNTTYNGVEMKEIKLTRNEFVNLQKKWRKGKPKIEAPTDGTDDFADCVAGAAYQAIKDKDFRSLAKPKLGLISTPRQNSSWGGTNTAWANRTSYGSNRW